MRELAMWATETKIMATAKMLQRDIYTWFDNKWLHFNHLREPSKDAIYLDNKYGRHFNVVFGTLNLVCKHCNICIYKCFCSCVFYRINNYSFYHINH